MHRRALPCVILNLSGRRRCLTTRPKASRFGARALTPEPYNRTLQQLLRSTFDNTRVRDRLLSIDEEETYFRFLNYKTDIRDCFCANFFGYEKGRIGQVIREAFDADQIDPSALPLARAADGTEQQFLDGKLYLVCLGDNVILAQDQYFRAKHVEHYLNAMLPNRRRLLLEPSINLHVRRRIRGVKGIRLAAPLSYASNVAPPESQSVTTTHNLPILSDEREVRQARLIPTGQTWDALKAFLGNTLDLTQFDTNGFIHPRDIEVSLYLSWQRKREDHVSDQLDTLANVFRRVDDEIEFEVDTQLGKIKRNELRLSKKQSVVHRDGFPVSSDIFEKMIDWYEELVEAGHI